MNHRIVCQGFAECNPIAGCGSKRVSWPASHTTPCRELHDYSDSECY